MNQIDPENADPSRASHSTDVVVRDTNPELQNALDKLSDLLASFQTVVQDLKMATR